MRLDLLADCPAGVPTSNVPNQDQDALAHRLKFCAAPVQKLGGDGTQWTIIDKAQPQFLLPLLGLHGIVAQQQAITSQRFWGSIRFGQDLLDQMQWLAIRRPGV